MIMERQELSIHNVIDSRWYNGASRLVLFFLAVLFLSVNAWCSCGTTTGCVESCSMLACQDGSIRSGIYQSTVTNWCNNQRNSLDQTRLVNYSCGMCASVAGFNSANYSYVICSTSREADSLKCINKGYNWTSDGDGECNEPLDESVCDSKRSTCEQLGGRFSGHAIKVDGQTCCSAECNLCGKANIQRILDLKAEECCSQLLAPPADIRQCLTPIQSAATCGMTMSSFSDGTNGEWACQDPDLDQTTMDRFIEKCASPGSSSSEVGSSGSNNSSSGEGGSSGEGQSSGGSPYPEGCDECPWLDSILDTLTMQKHRIEDIYLCVSVPQLCSGEGDQIQFDTSMLPYIRPFMDSSMKLDSNQIKALMKLDTNLLKLDTNLLKQLAVDSVRLKNDTAKLMSDSATRQALRGGFGLLDSTTDALNDTTRKWLHRIADSIHISTDSLIKHLDSIRKTVPDTILDSILKYQKMNAEKEDSIVISSLPGLDSLLDSSLNYWRSSADSMRALHEAIEDISIRMGYILGYGDTASSDLRNDINRNMEEISSFRDSVIKYYGASVDSIGSIHAGINDINGSLDGIKLLIGEGVSGWDSAAIVARWRDSVSRYAYTDAHYGHDVDSVSSSWGADTLDNGWEQSYQYGTCVGNDCPPCTDDSCMGRIKGNLVEYGDSVASELGARLQESVRQQKDSLPSFLDSTFQELKKYSWFGSFDSTFLSNIGAKIPNTNTCPEHCFQAQVNQTFGNVRYDLLLDWKLCRPIAPEQLNSLNAFDIIKLLARILTVVTCISIVMWDVSSSRGKIGL